MQNLNKDELFTLALHLDLPSLLSFCSSNKNIYKNLCLRNEIWIYKLKKDFPQFRNLNVINKTFKEIYQLLYNLNILKNKWEIIVNIYHLYDLRELRLDRSNLKEIPKEIGNLINLRILNLEYNQLTNIPKEIGDLTNLQILNLSHNQLTNIPKEIGNLTNLRVIYLNNNSLISLPKEIGNLKYLEKLYLSDNNLIKIPKEITDNKRIRFI